jgi:hypothetical protein
MATITSHRASLSSPPTIDGPDHAKLGQNEQYRDPSIVGRDLNDPIDAEPSANCCLQGRVVKARLPPQRTVKTTGRSRRGPNPRRRAKPPPSPRSIRAIVMVAKQREREPCHGPCGLCPAASSSGWQVAGGGHCKGSRLVGDLGFFPVSTSKDTTIL